MRLNARWMAAAVAAMALVAVLLPSLPGGAHAASMVKAAETKELSKPAIVVLGDSMSAEYGLPRGTGWVALLRERVTNARVDYSVVNASISGDTTSGGRARLPALLQRVKPAIVIVELGGNDALRGVPLATTEDNLRAIMRAAQQARAKVLLVGMAVPPNYGPDYAQKFQQLYGTLAKEMRVPLVPFLLAGIETRAELFQPDQIHPAQTAQPVLLNNVWPQLQPLLRITAPGAKTH